jgi:hypothetical protein
MERLTVGEACARFCTYVAATESLVYNQRSSLARSSLSERGSSSVVERDLAKVDVAGSTPVSRSSFSSFDPPRADGLFGRRKLT